MNRVKRTKSVSPPRASALQRFVQLTKNAAITIALKFVRIMHGSWIPHAHPIRCAATIHASPLSVKKATNAATTTTSKRVQTMLTAFRIHAETTKYVRNPAATSPASQGFARMAPISATAKTFSAVIIMRGKPKRHVPIPRSATPIKNNAHLHARQKATIAAAVKNPS